MTRLAEGQPPLDEYIASFQREFPSITRSDVARRRMRVLIALGFAEIDNGHVALTSIGRELVDGKDVGVVRAALRDRIAGVPEILEGDRRPEVADLSRSQTAIVRRWLAKFQLLEGSHNLSPRADRVPRGE
jgi:hypothetical protein